jgi:hypothetical protein
MTGPDPTPAPDAPQNAPQAPQAQPYVPAPPGGFRCYAHTVHERRVICYALEAMTELGKALGHDMTTHRDLIKRLHVRDGETP